MKNETEDSLHEQVNTAADRLDVAIDGIQQGAERLSAASERFAEKSPAKRASWLGYLLLIVAITTEFVEGFTFRGFEFSDVMSTNMMYIGGALVAVGAALDVFFSIKTIEAENARAAKLESEAAEARERVSSIRSWLGG